MTNTYFLSERYILERSLSDLIVPPSENSAMPIEPGLFKGDYGCHGTELIHLSYSNEGDEGVMFSGMKVTGDPNVPSGRNSFKGNVTIDSLRIPIYDQVRYLCIVPNSYCKDLHSYSDTLGPCVTLWRWPHSISL